MAEADLKATDRGLIPQGEGWFVLNARAASWIRSEERGQDTDFVHCPPWTHHVFVGAGDGPCVIVMTGSRAAGFEVVYPVNAAAAKHRASVLKETSSPDEAYAAFGPEERSPYRDGWLA